MADVLPVDTDSPAIARLDVPLAQLDADLRSLRLKRQKVAAHQYDVDHLDADSQYTLPGSYPVNYLTAGGAS